MTGEIRHGEIRHVAPKKPASGSPGNSDPEWKESGNIHKLEKNSLNFIRKTQVAENWLRNRVLFSDGV